jgi:flagellar basal body-associated protein FliL
MASNGNLSQERISQKLSPVAENKSRKGVIIGVSCAVVALVVVVAVVLVLVLPKNDTETRNTVVTPDNVDEVLASMQDNQKTQAGQYEVAMNTTWEFEDGNSASSNAYVENTTSNTNDVYFDIVRSDTGETIYKSPTIPVGSHLEGITLDTALEAGSYSCVLTYHLLDDSGEPISKLNINLDINVAN